MAKPIDPFEFERLANNVIKAMAAIGSAGARFKCAQDDLELARKEEVRALDQFRAYVADRAGFLDGRPGFSLQVGADQEGSDNG